MFSHLIYAAAAAYILHASPLQQDVYCVNFQVALGALGQWYAFVPINVSNASNTSRRQILAIGVSTAIFGLSDQSNAETCEACCLKDTLRYLGILKGKSSLGDT